MLNLPAPQLERRVCGGTRPNCRPPSTEAEDHETKETHLSAYSSGNRATAVFTLTLHAGTLVPVPPRGFSLSAPGTRPPSQHER